MPKKYVEIFPDVIVRRIIDDVRFANELPYETDDRIKAQCKNKIRPQPVMVMGVEFKESWRDSRRFVRCSQVENEYGVYDEPSLFMSYGKVGTPDERDAYQILRGDFGLLMALVFQSPIHSRCPQASVWGGVDTTEPLRRKVFGYGTDIAVIEKWIAHALLECTVLHNQKMIDDSKPENEP